MRDPRAAWWAIAAAALFIVHATCYLYFFVDDEGITMVYARSLLDGRGLTYAASEGPAEGYSNFLHVIVMAIVLSLVRVADLHPMWAFVAGGLFSTACGTALVILTWRLGDRLGLPLLPRAAAAFILALSAPLAVWSNSSLETVPFALAFLWLIASTVPDVRAAGASVAALAVMLMRVDGAVFVAAWLGARFVCGDAPARRLLLARVAPVVAVTAAVYATGRAWYFGAWLPLPLQTKVAHKLLSDEATVVWTTREAYLPAFAAQAGWPTLLGLAAVPAVFLLRRRREPLVWGMGLAVGALLAYVALVGDWMFGFRFFVPLLAPLAALCGVGLSAIQVRSPFVARVAAAVAIVLSGIAAVRFQAIYEENQRRPVFWKAPSLDPALRFGEYYEAYQALQPLVTPGMRIAYHEAGFVPFLLDVENVDMLGLTSTFAGAAPTRDAIFTDVGRYYPFTSEPAHHAVHAYLLYREPALIVVRRSWMRNAHRGRVPGEILRGHYALSAQSGTFLIYRRTGHPMEPRRLDADGFLENLAHPAYAERVAINGARIEPAGAITDVPSLWQAEQGHDIVVDPAWALHIDPRDISPVHEIYLSGGAPSAEVRVEVRLTAASGETLRAIDHTARAGEPIRIQQFLESPFPADAIDIRFASVSGRAVRLHLQAVRVMGQTPALRDHVERHGIR